MADNKNCPKCGRVTITKTQGGSETDRVCPKGCKQD